MIFTDRKITIRNGKSSINEPVILYRGDYEVSIKFTIMESKFRFKSGVNLVDSEKASHGQLAILAPYGGNVFSEIVKCEDGTVTFTLTKEMIDQLEEVGLYSFQIRLFDYYRESRVSIPPVEFGIEVREPVASEDHDNEVNNAIVGYSIAKVIDGLNEDVGPTFDADGQYNKTDWETGDRITEGKLNKIEDAIDKINQNEKADVSALDKRVTNNFNVLDSSKADKNEVFSMQNMGQDIKEAMTGGSVAVVDGECVNTNNITWDLKKDFTEYVDIKDTITWNEHNMSVSKNETLTIGTSSAWHHTIIPCVPGDRFKLTIQCSSGSSTYGIILADSDNIFIKGDLYSTGVTVIHKDYTLVVPPRVSQLICNTNDVAGNHPTFKISKLMSTGIASHPYVEEKLYKSNAIQNVEFEMGTIAGSTGKEGDSETRCRTTYLYLNKGVVIKSSDDVQVSAIRYDEKLSFLGSSDWRINGYTIPESGVYRIVAAYDNGTVIDIADMVTKVWIVILNEFENFKYELPEYSPDLKDDIASLSEITDMYWEMGTLSSSNGTENDRDTRCRTKYLKLKENSIITYPRDTKKVLVMEYDNEHNFIKQYGFNASGYRKIPNSGVFRVVAAYINDSIINAEDIDNFVSDVKIYTSLTTYDNIVDEYVAENDVVIMDYYTTVNVVKEEKQPYGFRNDGCFVNDELWIPEQTDDYGVNIGSIRIYKKEEGIWTLNRTINHNLGHLNSMNYCPVTDTLIAGNGSSSYSITGKIYIIENASSRTSVLQNEILVIDDANDSLGPKYNVVWGEHNFFQYDIAYMILNDGQTIHKIQLGTDNNVLERGSYVSTYTRFNGTYKILETHTQKEYGYDYCVQGADFYNGDTLVYGYGHNTGTISFKTVKFKNGEMEIKKYNMIKRLPDGSDVITTTGGLMVYEDTIVAASGGMLYYVKI